jgi:hypothetical protein
VIGRQYFARQAATLLKFAKSTTNPQLAAVLIEKAAELNSQIDESPPIQDKSPLAPDVEPRNLKRRMEKQDRPNADLTVLLKCGR